MIFKQQMIFSKEKVDRRRLSTELDLVQYWLPSNAAENSNSW